MAEEAEAPIEGEDTAPAENVAQDPPEAQDQGADTQPDDAPEIVELAREMGWSEKDNWRGEPDKWKDAKTFIRSTVDVNRSLSKDVRALKEQTSRIAQTSARIAEREIARARDELEAQFSEAVQNGDAQRAFNLSREIDRVEAQPATPSIDPPIEDFISRHADWWNKNDEATAYVMSVADRIAARGGNAQEQAREAESAVRKRFPELFDAPAARQQAKPSPSVSAPGSRAAPAPRAKSAANLPPDARKAGEDFVRRGRVGSLEEYAKLYYEEQE